MCINRVKLCIISINFLTFLPFKLELTLMFVSAIESKKVESKRGVKKFGRKLIKASWSNLFIKLLIWLFFSSDLTIPPNFFFSVWLFLWFFATTSKNLTLNYYRGLSWRHRIAQLILIEISLIKTTGIE